MHEPKQLPPRSRGRSRGSATTRPAAIVGPGRAGRAVGSALRRAGWPVVAVAGRHADAASTVAAASELGSVARGVDDAGRGAEVIILATPRGALYPLVRGVLESCEAIGPRDALTGPVMRGDRETVDAHLVALPPEERVLYRALAAEALRLSGRDDPELAARLR